jgi:hypothetical protein
MEIKTTQLVKVMIVSITIRNQEVRRKELEEEYP